MTKPELKKRIGIAASRKIADTVIKNAKIVDVFNSKINELGITSTVEPVMPLCFMALPVIPEIKLTDKGLFGVL